MPSGSVNLTRDLGEPDVSDSTYGAAMAGAAE